MFCLCNNVLASFAIFQLSKVDLIINLYDFQKLNLSFVDAENDLCHECEVVDCKKLNLYWVYSSLVHF